MSSMLADDRAGMRVYRFASLPAQRCDALVSTRGGGVSVGRYWSLNLGLHVGDDADAVVENRRRLFDGYGLRLERSVWCRQIHRDHVTVVTADTLGDSGQRGALTEDDVITDTDALVTDLVGVSLCVTLADCVPVVLYDPAHHALGLVHDGWGGTVRRLASRTVAVMSERFGTEPAQLVAAVGPSIAPEDYEVGPEVIEAARAAYGPTAGELLRPLPDGKAQFDLWTANVIDLVSAGVPREAIEVSAISTAAHLDAFYSHRAEGGPTGRLIAAATLR